MKEVTAIFDIGKTNKKFFLFDRDYRQVYREYVRFEEIADENGFPAENLQAMETWCKEVLDRMLNSSDYSIQAVNFSCYGASLVHIDENGKVLTPLYNYMKPLNDEIYKSFYDKYGPEIELSRATGTPKLGMLSTGMHLFWLKYTKPEIFKKINFSLHLPQYLSYLFTGIPVSEYTSIGCHTMLWDYNKKDYHDWVYQEGIDKILPPIADTEKTVPTVYKGINLQIGIGIHDSSSALLPYVRSVKKTFLLVSTGTWSISINPFVNGLLTKEDIKKESLFNMRINGSPVKVSRLFLGNEYRLQVKALSAYYEVPDDHHKKMKFSGHIFSEINKNFRYMFKWMSIRDRNMPSETEMPYEEFKYAYHQLMLELVLLQVASIKSAIGSTPIERLFIDGGFSDNEVYLQLLSHHFPKLKLKTTDSSLGSALGAAIVISNAELKPKFLKRNYALKKHIPFVLKK